MKNSLIILSGGMDSVTLLHLSQREYRSCGNISIMVAIITRGKPNTLPIIASSSVSKIGKKLGIDYSKTYSCYKGGEKHCGKCGTYVEHKEALRDAGIDDPTEYEE